ncbi:MAG: DNA-3-methyladenine glycosylase [Chthoniobacterales bacterium]|nr:DNA-3-methyladenine glycosylase [Chthoniobacterales bacterium]MCX7713388.1 DNA-3-methyladenine glycosylase [Chthoniobacterales bacterium]
MQVEETKKLIRAERDFFRQSPLDCARQLVGAYLEWEGFFARIVETEAYAAVGDPACHTFSRPSARAFVATHPPGAAYVYFNYGFYWMFNLLVRGDKGDGFVLFRGLELVRTPAALTHLLDDPRACAGPGKLARTLRIDRSHHGLDICLQYDKAIYFSSSGGEQQDVQVSVGPRVGISRATDLPWRFGLKGSAALSKPFPNTTKLKTNSKKGK